MHALIQQHRVALLRERAEEPKVRVVARGEEQRCGCAEVALEAVLKRFVGGEGNEEARACCAEGF
jgi:hypothetical protein